MTERKEAPNELAHYGVKGMKWGVKKAKTNEPQNSRYSQSKRSADKATFGSRGVKRINRRMNQGKTYKQAIRREFGVTAAKGFAVAGTSIAYGLLQTYGPVLSQDVAKRAQTKRGQAAAASMMGLPNKASSGPSYSKRDRSGTYKISSL